jgi:phosphatidylserine/phosphatidylglycerophosphate/cardiolipin synthase-like enzyme
MRVTAVFYNFIFLIFIVFSLSSKSQVLFSPKDKITNYLIKRINSSKKNIYIAVYMLTDKKIAQALVDAKNKRDLDVQVITDQTCLEYKHGKVDMLKNANIDVFVYKNNLKNKKRPSKLMHNKFAIFDNILWTGSFNWTVQANHQNKENVLLTDDPDILKKYKDQFELLKQRCVKQAIYVFAKKKTKMQKAQEKTTLFKDRLIDFFKSIRAKNRS